MKNEPSPNVSQISHRMVEQPSQGNKRVFRLEPNNSSIRIQATIEEIHVASPTTNNHSYPESYQPAIVHACFDPRRESIDPARPLTDIPDPQPRASDQLQEIFTNRSTPDQSNSNNEPSKWDLIASNELADYLQKQQQHNKIALPHDFYHNTSLQPLLSSIEDMSLVDSNDIHKALDQLSTDSKILIRQGFVTRKCFASAMAKKAKAKIATTSRQPPLWKAILQPMKKHGMASLDNDIITISIVQHALKQCRMRQRLNNNLTLEQITDFVRSYTLSQTKLLPAKAEQLRNMPIYQGHILLVAQILGWTMAKDDAGEWRFNVSSRSSLFNRYPILSDYRV